MAIVPEIANCLVNIFESDLICESIHHQNHIPLNLAKIAISLSKNKNMKYQLGYELKQILLIN